MKVKKEINYSAPLVLGRSWHLCLWRCHRLYYRRTFGAFEQAGISSCSIFSAA
jgi:hypothetical protein